ARYLFLSSLIHTSTTQFYALSLHDALPISIAAQAVLPYHCGHWLEPPVLVLNGVLIAWISAGFWMALMGFWVLVRGGDQHAVQQDRKSTRLNSSHVAISYAVFCLKKKKRVA